MLWHYDVIRLKNHYVMTSLHFDIMMSLCYDILTLFYDSIAL